ncbi:MAG: 3-oxoacyl-ACP synthase [Labilithrix sp.]|nr:3-oxoacyl-ACP synthase [Labilithrix sp.]MCW5816336.1 3-oxoacyl-ACP synthase [Labilithrix sp.]
MSAAGVVAYGAISALGRGDAAFRVSSERERTCVRRDEELSAAGLRRPYCARADISGTADRATLLLDAALADCMQMLDRVRPGWRELRVGLALGTSSGGMRTFEASTTEALGGVRSVDASTTSGGTPVFEARAAGVAATYAGPVAAVSFAAARVFAPASIVLAACASSAIALGLGRAWLDDDRCDLVLAGGFDAVSVFVATGFECLRATCGERGPRPFRRDRDGLALGEGAAVVALARARSAEDARAWITGFGATCDAHHLTAPEPNGAGLARAARRALEDAGAPSFGLVSAHGTGTSQNDAAEARALASLASAAEASTLASLRTVPAFSFKGTIGHTLGAAGALETLATIDALERGLIPATHGDGDVEPGAHLHDVATSSSARTALKLASAFGGANAALVVTLDPAEDGVSASRPDTPHPPPPPEPALPAGAMRMTRGRRRVFATRAVAVDVVELEPARLAAKTGYAVDRIARADELVRWSMAVVAALQARTGSLRGAGIVVGLGLATIETNARFLARLSRPEPRRFPYTTPNAAAGECAVAFGLDGPAFAVGGGPHGGLEAIAVAADLVRARVADRIVVVAADEAGEVSARLARGTASGAVALLVQSTPADAELEDWTVEYGPTPTPTPALPAALPPMSAHRALLPLVGATPAQLATSVPWGGRATITLRWM